MPIANSDQSFISKISILFLQNVHHIIFVNTEFYSVQSQSTVLSFAILQSTFIFSAVITQYSSGSCVLCCWPSLQVSYKLVKQQRLQHGSLWHYRAWPQCQSTVYPHFVSSAYPVIYPKVDLPPYLMTDDFLSYPSGEGYCWKPLETI